MPELRQPRQERGCAENRPVRARGLKRQGLLRSRRRISATRAPPPMTNLRGKCFAASHASPRSWARADLRRSCGRSTDLVETLAQPKQHPSKTLLRDREDLAIAARPPRLPGRKSSGASEASSYERTRARGTSALPARARRACSRAGSRSSAAGASVSHRPQWCAAAAATTRRFRRARSAGVSAAARSSRSPAGRGAPLPVHAVRRPRAPRRQLRPARPPRRPTATHASPDSRRARRAGRGSRRDAGIGQLVRTSSEQRVSEPDPVAVKHDDTSFECRSEAVVAPDARRGFDDAHRRVRESSGREQIVAALWRERLETAVDELVQGLRHGQRLTRLDGDARAAKHAHDLEGVERVPARCLDAPRREAAAAGRHPGDPGRRGAELRPPRGRHRYR